MSSLFEPFLPQDKTKNHALRLHHWPERVFEESILGGLETRRESRLARPSIP